MGWRCNPLRAGVGNAPRADHEFPRVFEIPSRLSRAIGWYQPMFLKGFEFAGMAL